jgi:methionyl-tRNA formyltransferase
MMRTIFFGTPDFAVPCLQELARKTEVVLVVTTPDVPRGRGKKVLPCPVKVAAEALGLPVAQPTSVRDLDFIDSIVDLKADLGVIVAYGRLLGRRILFAPRLRCVNVHASLLPVLRGAAPIQRSIMDGHEKTGVSMMRMNLGLDAGAVYFTRETNIRDDDTSGSLHDRLSLIGANALGEFVDMADSGTLDDPFNQDPDKVTYASKIETHDEWINWHDSAAHIERLIRGLSPKPSASTHFRGKRLRILEAEVVESDEDEFSEGETGGKIIVPDSFVHPENTDYEASADFITPDGTGEIVIEGKSFEVICGYGILRLKVVQMEGKKAVPVEDFMNGYRVENGELLGGSES